MRNRRQLLRCIVYFAVGAALLAPFSRGTEPRYQGRTLTAWLIQAEETHSQPAEFEAPRNALLSMGTNALPFLVKWTTWPRPNLKSEAIALLAEARASRFGCWIPEALTRDLAYVRAQTTPYGFHVLGPVAARAVPELSRKLRATPDDLTAYTCLQALSDIGPQGIPGLCVVLTNPPPKSWSTGGRSPRVAAVKYLIVLGTNAVTAVPVLLQLLADKDPAVAAHAALALGFLGRGQAPVVTALTFALRDPRAWVRSCAVAALHRLGAEVRPAIPAILQTLSDEDAWVREVATNTVQRLVPETFITNAPRLLFELREAVSN